MRRVAVVGTGGTISNRGNEPLDYLSYMDVGEVLDVEAALARFPLVQQVAEIEPVPFEKLRSKAVGEKEWVTLRGIVDRLLSRRDIDGVVITHGTATLEETAYFLHLTVPHEKPFVLVGAQRPAPTISSDAYANLISAVRVAGSEDSIGQGALVVMNETIHSARDVAKTSNHRLQTMRSPELGPLGYVDPDGRVAFYRSTTRRHTSRSEFAGRRWPEDGPYPRVDIVYSHAGADGAAVAGFLRRGTDGIVAAGLPPGLNTVDQDRALQEAYDAGVAVVQGSRAAGRVIPRATRTLLSEASTSDNLTAQSARVLLLVALASGVDRGDLQRVFDTY